MSEHSAEAFLEGLAGCDFFAGLPPAAAQVVRDGVAAAVAQGEKPAAGLVRATPDSAFLLADAPYTALLTQFASASHGAFAPEAIREEPSGDAVRFTFRCAGREFAASLPADAFDVPDAFFATINTAMEASGSPLRFLEVPGLGWEPIPGFTLATPEAFRRAAAAGWLGQESGEVTEEEIEGYARVLTVALVGAETFYWTVDGITLLELRVPGGYETDDTDNRKKGDGLFTVLGWEGVGTLILQCAAPVGAHLGTPKEFRVEDSSEREDRHVVGGRARLSGTDVVWRQDTLKGSPLHATFCVTKDFVPAFAEALDSMRALEPTAETAALFASCTAPPPTRAKPRKGRR
jgi:hypothetical protein